MNSFDIIAGIILAPRSANNLAAVELKASTVISLNDFQTREGLEFTIADDTLDLDVCAVSIAIHNASEYDAHVASRILDNIVIYSAYVGLQLGLIAYTVLSMIYHLWATEGIHSRVLLGVVAEQGATCRLDGAVYMAESRLRTMRNQWTNTCVTPDYVGLDLNCSPLHTTRTLIHESLLSNTFWHERALKLVVAKAAHSLTAPSHLRQQCSRF
ncbi:hypothetical protein BDV23DRAFT_182833 [Aspergillus alliaceus]|uniref:Uncharacterized protein n=1 Tax=Petromyces alliaceus TaxID=209559 RepID=A0A5N7CC06_PETAA|nr:hypothetical protein BDV23DRAFT_182833 [Aspergillus alliaceus]